MITPIEVMSLRVAPTDEGLAWCKTIAAVYGAKPAKNNELAFYTFVWDIYRAGRIDGVRAERARKRAG